LCLLLQLQVVLDAEIQPAPAQQDIEPAGGPST
jgi:hypothetical protein